MKDYYTNLLADMIADNDTFKIKLNGNRTDSNYFDLNKESIIEFRRFLDVIDNRLLCDPS